MKTNCSTQFKQQNCSSRYKGVTWNKRDKKWNVAIHYRQQAIHIGCFRNEIEGALAYNKMAEKLFGDSAILNVIPFVAEDI